jgi:hypothetical protein
MVSTYENGWRMEGAGRRSEKKKKWLVAAGGVLSYLTFIDISFWQSNLLLLYTYLPVQMHQNLKINIQR